MASAGTLSAPQRRLVPKASAVLCGSTQRSLRCAAAKRLRTAAPTRRGRHGTARASLELTENLVRADGVCDWETIVAPKAQPLAYGSHSFGADGWSFGSEDDQDDSPKYAWGFDQWKSSLQEGNDLLASSDKCILAPPAGARFTTVLVRTSVGRKAVRTWEAGPEPHRSNMVRFRPSRRKQAPRTGVVDGISTSRP